MGLILAFFNLISPNTPENDPSSSLSVESVKDFFFFQSLPSPHSAINNKTHSEGLAELLSSECQQSNGHDNIKENKFWADQVGIPIILTASVARH